MPTLPPNRKTHFEEWVAGGGRTAVIESHNDNGKVGLVRSFLFYTAGKEPVKWRIWLNDSGNDQDGGGVGPSAAPARTENLFRTGWQAPGLYSASPSSWVTRPRARVNCIRKASGLPLISGAISCHGRSRAR